jgi:YD repeat-containing protein
MGGREDDRSWARQGFAIAPRIDRLIGNPRTLNPGHFCADCRNQLACEAEPFRRTGINMRLSREKTPARFLVALFLLLLTLLSAVAAQQGGTTRYTYDGNGRLKTVTLPTGEVAVYDYDGAGNLVSITRRVITTIFAFSPANGAIGTQVTLNGNGFLTTPAANEVKFNGVAAQVISATATQLLAEVPLGATSGFITVTNTNGTATSAQAFGVLENQAPVISNFSPSIGTVGTVVTITGTGFSPTPANNLISFNNLTATVNASTETSIVTSVPAGATSGRISVATANGTAISNRDFLATNAELVAQMNIGESKTVTINTPDRTALLFFSGVAAQKVSLTLTEMNLGGADHRVYLLAPNGNQLGATGVDVSRTYIDTLTLEVTGTYAILVDLQGGTGSLKVNLHHVVDLSGTIPLGGPAVPVHITTPGQRGQLTFNATSGQRLILRLTNVTSTGLISFSILDPDGLPIVNGADSGIGSKLLRTGVLPATGSYSIAIDTDHFFPTTGSVTLTLATQPADVTGSLTVGGASLTLLTNTPGQDAIASFAGTAGQRLNLLLHPVTLPQSVVSIYNPDGSLLVPPMSVDTRGWFVELPELPVSGTYTIEVVPFSDATGSATLSLMVAAPIAITPGGAALALSLTTPNQRPRLSFSGTAGQRLSLNVPSMTTLNRCTIQFLNPDGTELSATTILRTGGSRFIEPQTLPATGTYTIVVTPQFITDTGSLTLALYDVPADVSGTLIVGDPAAALTIATPGQNAALNFNGTAGQQITVRLSANTLSTVTVSMLAPDGSILTLLTIAAGSFTLPTQTLPATGTYSVKLDPFGANTGSIGLRLTNP